MVLGATLHGHSETHGNVRLKGEGASNEKIVAGPRRKGTNFVTSAY
jgi:hypothetical protein